MSTCSLKCRPTCVRLYAKRFLVNIVQSILNTLLPTCYNNVTILYIIMFYVIIDKLPLHKPFCYNNFWIHGIGAHSNTFYL